MKKDREELLLKMLYESNIMDNYGMVYDQKIQEYFLNTIGNTYVIYFRNNERIIRFSCNYEYNNRTTIGIEISNNKDIITIEDWINLKYGFGKYQCFSWPNEEDFVQKVREMISVLEQIFSEEKMSKILKGEHWEHVPFGWFGQR